MSDDNYESEHFDHLDNADAEPGYAGTSYGDPETSRRLGIGVQGGDGEDYTGQGPDAGISAQQLELEAQELTEDFPELAEVGPARALVARAREVAEEMGAPELAHQPQFWRAVHLASGGADRRAHDAGSRETWQPQDLGDLIVRFDRLGRRALPFG